MPLNILIQSYNNNILSVSIKGHAKNNKVCHAISGAFEMLLIGLTTILSLPITYNNSKGNAFIKLPNNIPERNLLQANILLKSFYKFTVELAKKYGEPLIQAKNIY